MDFQSWTSQPGFGPRTGNDFGKRKDYRESSCRDLVLVPGGADWIIRELDEKFPDCCWKFAGTSSIAQYHFSQAAKANENLFFENVAPSKQSIPSLPVFFATLPHFYSPTDFSVQPKYLDEFRNKMCDEMDQEYSGSDQQRMDFQHLVPGVACATFDGTHWVRARVEKMAGNENAFTEFVDFGTSKIIPVRDLFRLKKRFGKVPPMALHCRMKDVFMNDLDGHKVDAFHELIIECGRVVRVELAALDEPYVVNLYHPTIVGINLGSMFYRRPEVEKKQVPAKLDTKDTQSEENNSEDEDEDEDYGDYDEEIEDEEPEAVEIYAVRTLAKAPKVFRACVRTLIPGHIENGNTVVLHDKSQLERRAIMEKKFEEMHETGSLDQLPIDWMTPLTSCILLRNTSKPQLCRASIEIIEDDYIELSLIDHGSWTRIPIDEAKDRLFALPEEFAEEPMVYLVSLKERGIWPHPDFTKQLRILLDGCTEVTFHPEIGAKSVPVRGILSNALHEDLGREAEEILQMEGQDTNCRTISLFRPPFFYDLLRKQIDLSFIHRPHPSQTHQRGKLTFDLLSNQ